MRKFLTAFAALFIAVGLTVPACATDASSSNSSEYPESQQYVYLAEEANMYLAPDETSDVYLTAETAYNEEILISGVTDDGWAIYKYWYKENGISKYLWLYIAPQDIIWDELDAYTEAEYQDDENSADIQLWQESVQPYFIAMKIIMYLEILFLGVFALTFICSNSNCSDKIAQVCIILHIAVSAVWIFVCYAALYNSLTAGLYLYGNAVVSTLYVMFGLTLSTLVPGFEVVVYSRELS